jgi:hypothetical protein
MRPSGKAVYRLLAVLFVLCSLAALVWMRATGPVLFHMHMWSKTEPCGAYAEVVTGITVLNPFRSRAPEHVADEFLRDAAKGICSPGLDERICKFMATHPLGVVRRRLVYRWDSGARTELVYRQKPPAICRVLVVSLERIGVAWRVVGVSN